MGNYFEWNEEYNTITLTSRPGHELDYEDAQELHEELTELLGAMEDREKELDAEHEREYRETDAYLERFWRE